MRNEPFLTAKEAAAMLEVTLSTLYAYVSRGLIRSEAVGGGGRRYHREDVEQLQKRKLARRHPEQALAGALHWGMPVLESAITLIAGGRFYYRGHDVLELATTRSVEEVAALIWTGSFETQMFAREQVSLPPAIAQITGQLALLLAVERFQAALPLAAVSDAAAYDTRPPATARTGARILRLIAGLAAGSAGSELSVASQLQQGWAPHDAAAARLITSALVLCADHELNVSSFTARCVASAGSSPYAVVGAGLAALLGPRHGGQTARVEALLQEIGVPDRARAAIAGRLKRGEPVPGFGHPLYPDGDPRGRFLLAQTAATYPEAPVLLLVQRLAAEVHDLLGEQPTVDLALVTLAQVLRLPAGGALALFALGRTIGWLGHALEQVEVDRLIRPRARYVGTPPEAVRRAGGKP
jgi:citrate synthase